MKPGVVCFNSAVNGTYFGINLVYSIANLKLALYRIKYNNFFIWNSSVITIIKQ